MRADTDEPKAHDPGDAADCDAIEFHLVIPSLFLVGILLVLRGKRSRAAVARLPFAWPVDGSRPWYFGVGR